MNKFTSILSKINKYYKLQRMDKKDYEEYIINEYKSRTGESLNLNPPETFTDKIQYAKIYLNSPLKTKLTDKYLVREWISNEIGEEYLIPLLGVWDKYSEINFNALPRKFVLKTNHSSGWNLIVTDKYQINHLKEKIKFDLWTNINFGYYTDLQLQYTNIKPKIVAEEFIEDKKGQLYDYRFLCFNGKVCYCWVGLDGENQRYGNIYDLEWNLQSWTFTGLPNTPFEVSIPENFEEMVSIATKLSKKFSHVRVDLYNVDGKIYFGEMTFTSSAGYRLITPDKYNYKLGNFWDIKNSDHYKTLQK